MQALSLLTDPNAWAARVTLTALEIVLGIDNLVFISLVGQSRRRLHCNASHNQGAGARFPGADRDCAGCRRLRVPYPARLHLFSHALCRRCESLQRHGTAQPPAAASHLTLDRQTLLGDIATAGRFGP